MDNLCHTPGDIIIPVCFAPRSRPDLAAARHICEPAPRVVGGLWSWRERALRAAAVNLCTGGFKGCAAAWAALGCTWPRSGRLPNL